MDCGLSRLLRSVDKVFVWAVFTVGTNICLTAVCSVYQWIVTLLFYHVFYRCFTRFRCIPLFKVYSYNVKAIFLTGGTLSLRYEGFLSISMILCGDGNQCSEDESSWQVIVLSSLVISPSQHPTPCHTRSVYVFVPWKKTGQFRPIVWLCVEREWVAEVFSTNCKWANCSISPNQLRVSAIFVSANKMVTFGKMKWRFISDPPVRNQNVLRLFKVLTKALAEMMVGCYDSMEGLMRMLLSQLPQCGCIYITLVF